MSNMYVYFYLISSSSFNLKKEAIKKNPLSTFDAAELSYQLLNLLIIKHGLTY